LSGFYNRVEQILWNIAGSGLGAFAMSIHRKILFLICAAIGALAVLALPPSHDLGRIESAAPPYAVALAGPEPTEESDMAALRQQASLALAQLQTRATPAVAGH
jgi:hypothetical protein